MPPVAIGAAAAAAGAAAAGATIATVITTFAISLALGFVSQLLAPKAPRINRRERGINVTVRSSIAPHQVIYGTSVVGGVMIFAELTGSNNEFIHLVVALSGHEVEAIDSVFLDDNEITGSGVIATGRFANKLRISKHLGADSQAADTDLVAEVTNWTTAHRGRGVAYVYLRLEFDRDAYPNGIPSIRAKVRGKKVWDPRANPSNPSVKSFDNNAALCQLDFAMFANGFNLGLSEIDETSWLASANVADQSVALKDGGSPTLFETRYTCDGAFELPNNQSDSLNKIMEDLLTTSLGSVVWQQGKLHGYASAATVATFALTTADLRGNLSATTRPNRDKVFNAVRGIYVDETQNYIPTSFPPQTNSSYETDDGGERIFEDIQLAFTNGVERAQRLARLSLDISRQAIVVRWPAKLAQFGIAVWDTGTLTVADFGWTNKKFRCLDWALGPDGGIDLILREEVDSVYTLDLANIVTVDPAPDTTLPDPWTVSAPTELILSSDESHAIINAEGNISQRLKVSWTPPADSFVVRNEVEFRNVTGSPTEDWQPVASVTGSSTFTFITPVRVGNTYDVRVRAVNALGVASAYTEVLGHIVVGFGSLVTQDTLENPSFEAGDIGWTETSDWKIVKDSSNARRGNWVAKLDGPGSLSNPKLMNDRIFPVQEGDRLLYNVWLKFESNGSPTGGPGQASLAFKFYDENLVVVRQINALGGIGSSEPKNNEGTYLNLRSLFVVESGFNIAYCNIGIGVFTSGLLGTFYVDDAQLTLLEKSTDITDSAVATASSDETIGGSPTWDDILSLSLVPPKDSIIHLSAVAQFEDLSTGSQVDIRIVRGTSTIVYGPVRALNSPTGVAEIRTSALSARDSPSSGTQTYRVQASLISGSAKVTGPRSLWAWERKD